ncbi:hypothetical protein C5S39_08675, partial [Candidatus Methanophagaceae archaeon]
ENDKPKCWSSNTMIKKYDLLLARSMAGILQYAKIKNV